MLRVCYMHVTRRCLIIKRHHGEKILNGEKTIEVRSRQLVKHLGKRCGIIYVGTSKVFGFVKFTGTFKFDQANWDSERPRHRCSELEVAYGGRAWAWECADPERLEVPRQIERNGARIFQSVKFE